MATTDNLRRVAMVFGNTIRKDANSFVVTIPAYLIGNDLLREGQYVRLAVLEEEDENDY